MSVLRKKAKSDAATEYTCSIRFLDDSETIQLTFKKDTLGQWLFDRVCEKLNLVEKDYFGLRYVDLDNQRHWLDPLKTVYKQMKGISKMVLCFRVKFYPDDPMKLHEEITRYFLFLQLRRDLHHGRLLCPPEDSIQLAACIIQSEVGDYDPQDHPVGYISSFKMLPKQTPRHEEKIMEAHKALVGKVPAECESSFLKKSASMETYGVDPHQVKDQKGDPLYLGVTHLGIMTFRGNRRTQLFKWNQVRRIAYEGKMFIVNHNSLEDDDASNSKKKHQAVGFKCQTAPAAKYLWRCAVEQQLFFTLSSSNTAPKIRSGGSLFSRGSKFRFSGRCQNEVYEASENIRRAEPPFSRTSSLPNFVKKNHVHDKMNNSVHEPRAASSFREDRRQFNVYLATGKNQQEAAVDVPNIVNEAATVITPSKKEEVLEQAPKLQAPLAQVEAFEEKLQQSSDREELIVAAAAVPVQQSQPAPQPCVENSKVPARPPSPVAPPRSHTTSPVKENGEIVRDKSGILETSIDDTLPYEPNQTLEESDMEAEKSEEDHPCLDDQVKQLEKEIIQPDVQKDLSAPSPITQTSPTPAAPAQKKNAGKSHAVAVCLKSIFVSIFLMLLFSAIIFYVVFFSQVDHPYVSKMREHLHFLEPVKNTVQQKATEAISYFRK